MMRSLLVRANQYKEMSFCLQTPSSSELGLIFILALQENFTASIFV